MNTANRYLVFYTTTHSCLRVFLTLLMLFSFYLSILLGYLWLYCISFALLIIIIYFLSVLYSHVSFSNQGIKLRYGLCKAYEMGWEEVVCCGTFSLTILGASREEEYIYFSKKPISHFRLELDKTLPPQSDDFIFLSKQKNAIVSVGRFWNSTKVKNLCLSKYREDNMQNNILAHSDLLYYILAILCLLCVISYALSKDERWLFVALSSAVVLLEVNRMKQ